MSKKLAFILDECLGQLNRGESVEACLRRYPHYAAELEPLLRQYLSIRDIPQVRTPPPRSPDAVQLGRARVLAEARRLRAALPSRPPSLTERIQQFWTPLVQRGLASSAVVLVLVIALLAGGSVMASANSLPGDPLYGVKRISQEVQLALTLNSEAKAQLRQRLDEQRRQEALAVTQVGRIVTVDFGGVVESMGDGVWVVSGLKIYLGTDAVIVGEVAVGDRIQVRAVTQADRTLRAIRIQREVEPIVVVPTASPTITATVTPLAPTQTPTEKSQAKEHVVTATATVTSMPTATATVPTPTRTLTLPPTATATPAPPTDTPTPPREMKVRFSGIITAMEGDLWVISGQTIRVTAETVIDESAARAAIGAWAQVTAVGESGNILRALKIIIERASERVEFQGIIQSIGANSWVVGDQTVRIDASTVIEGSPEVGSLAIVKGIRLGPSEVLAREIKVQVPQVVEFEGIITSIQGNEWVVDNIRVLIDNQTIIEGEPRIGCRAEVRGLLRPDGSVQATRIRVVEPAATPTPTTTSVPECTATPTATLEVSAIHSPTPEATETEVGLGAAVHLSERTE
ncbi:MAG: hypothetical protein H5T64_01730 [Chloroflexi bacterium]|nr:hypothetical protein [Chloroflexota bacterium]